MIILKEIRVLMFMRLQKMMDMMSYTIMIQTALQTKYSSVISRCVKYNFSSTSYEVNQFVFSDGATIDKIMIGTTGNDALTGTTANDLNVGAGGGTDKVLLS